MNAAVNIEDATANHDRQRLAEERAAELVRAYGDLDGLDLLAPMIEKEFPGRIALSSSFGAEAAVLLDLVAQVDPATPVIFIDTGKLFEETYTYLALLSDHLGLTKVRTIGPDPVRLQESDPNGNLWQSDPDACCHIRKVEPLKSALAGFDAWITGRKQYHGDLRLSLESIEAVDGFIKINPLVNWDYEKIQSVFADRKLPPHPLVARGYPSIGCYHCTREVVEGEDLRAGRWEGEEKTECGIHHASWASGQ